MDKLPQIHASHIQERDSYQRLESILPRELFLLRKEDGGDYGVDRILEVVAQGFVTNIRSHLQVKSTRAKSKKSSTHSFPIPVSTLNYLLNSLNSLFLVYSENEDTFYWEWAGVISYARKQAKNRAKVDNAKTFSYQFRKTLTSEAIQKIHERLLNDSTLVNSLNLETSPFARVLVTDYLQNSNYRDYLKLFSEGKYERVIALVKEGIESSPTLWSLVALCYYNLYNYDEALKYILKAEEEEKSPEFDKIRVAILCEKGIREHNKISLHQAKELFLSIESDNWTWIDSYNFGNILSALGELDEAESNYRNALRLEPDEAMIWKNLGDIFRKRKNYHQELTYLNRALELNPLLFEGLVSKGILLGQQFSDFEQALTFLEKALEQSKSSFRDSRSVYWWIGIFSNEIGNYEYSLQIVSEGLRLSPGDGYLENLRLRTLLLGSNESEVYESEAIQLLQEIRANFPRDVRTRIELLRLLGRRKNVPELLPLVVETFAIQDYQIEPEVAAALQISEIVYILENHDALIEYRKIANFCQLLFERYNISIVKAQKLEIRANFIFSSFNAKLSSVAPEEILDVFDNHASEFVKFGEMCAEILVDATELDSIEMKANAITELVTTLPEVLLIEFSRQAGWLVQRHNLPVSTMDELIEHKQNVDKWFDNCVEPILRGANNVLNWAKK